MQPIVAAFVTLGTAAIAASVAYQLSKPGSQGPKLAATGKDLVVESLGILYK